MFEEVVGRAAWSSFTGIPSLHTARLATETVKSVCILRKGGHNLQIRLAPVPTFHICEITSGLWFSTETSRSLAWDQTSGYNLGMDFRKPFLFLG